MVVRLCRSLLGKSSRLDSHRFLRTASAALAAALIALIAQTRAAQAVDPAVDLAVEAFAVGGAQVGLAIGANEKAFVKGVAQCVVDGTPVVECGKQAAMSAILQRVPKDAQNFANCIARGADVGSCASNEVIGRLPKQVQPVARCVVEGTDVAECAKRFALDQAQSAVQHALTQAEQAAFATLNKLKADGRAALGQAPSSIQNILKVADGLRRDDWQQVLQYGGAEVAKFAVKAVLTAVLPPTAAVMQIIAPAIDTMVQNRFDLAVDLVVAVKANDTPRIFQVLTEFYLTMHVEVACALIPTIDHPDINDFREVTCGTIGKIIKAVGQAGNTAARTVVGAVRDAIDWTGIPDMLDETFIPGAVDDAFGFFEDIVSGRIFTGKEKPEVCGPGDRYYAENFVQCFHRGTFLRPNQAEFASFDEYLYGSCRKHYIVCHISTTVDRICGPMRSKFREHVTKIDAGLTDAADMYARGLRSFVEAAGTRTCQQSFLQREVEEFISGCERALQANIPLIGDPTWPNCRPSGNQQMSRANSAHKEACRRAVQRADLSRMTAETCQQAFQQGLPATNVGFGSPAGTGILDDRMPVGPRATDTVGVGPPASVGGLRGEPIPPSRDPGTVGVGAARPFDVFNPPPQIEIGGGSPLEGGSRAECVGGRRSGRDCICPPGERAVRFLSGARCMPILEILTCTGGRVGAPPDCACPPGLNWNGNECAATVAAPSPARPRPAPAQPQPQGCPAGTIPTASGTCAIANVPQEILCGPGQRPVNGRCVSVQGTTCGPNQMATPLGCISINSGSGGGANRPRPGSQPSQPPAQAKRECPTGYRVLDKPNRYGAYCEIIPVAGPTPPSPSPPVDYGASMTCKSWEVIRNGVCACPLGMTGPRCEQVAGPR